MIDSSDISNGCIAGGFGKLVEVWVWSVHGYLIRVLRLII